MKLCFAKEDTKSFTFLGQQKPIIPPKVISPSPSPKISPQHSPRGSFTQNHNHSTNPAVLSAQNISSLAPRAKIFQRSESPPVPPKPDDLVKSFSESTFTSEVSCDSSDIENQNLDELNKNNLEFMKAEYDHPKGEEEELELRENDIVCLLERTSEDWYYVTKDGETCGFVAASFLTNYSGELPEQLKSIVFTADDHSETSMSSLESFESQKLSQTGQGGDKDHNSSSKIKTKIRSGSKFLKRRRRKSTSFTRTTATDITIQRQDTLPELKLAKATRHCNAEIIEKPLQPRLHREKIVEEIVFTEDHYVHILSTLIDVRISFYMK